MSGWHRDNSSAFLIEHAVWIAADYLKRSGEMDDPDETIRFLVDHIEVMICRGQLNSIVLANRAIAAFQRYREARTLEATLIS